MLHKKNIHSVSLNNTPIWQFKLPEEFKIWNDIKRVEDTLFFEARKGVIRNNNVYGLDIHTGKIKWEFHFSLEENTGFVATNVDKKTNLSYGYGGIYYQVFDPVNGRMLLSKDMTKYYEQNVQPVSWNNAIADNRLWFVSGQGENAKFGALNIETSEMEFIQDYPLANNGQFSKPVFYDGKLYLLDHYNKELHIFEK
jgi:outer membrane protein assembly factor BamB